MEVLIPFKFPTVDICRELSNKHNLRLNKFDTNYRSSPTIKISKFTSPKNTYNATGNGHCTCNSVCYLISKSEVSVKKIKILATDEIHENYDKYEFIPNNMLIQLEQDTRSMYPVDCAGEYQFIALSGKLPIHIFVFDRGLPIPE